MNFNGLCVISMFFNGYLFLFSVSFILPIFLVLAFITPLQALPLYLPTSVEAEVGYQNDTLSPVEKIFSEPPKWHNPCGSKRIPNSSMKINGNNYFGDYGSTVEHPSDSDLMHGITSIARVALRQGRFFKEDYVSFDFNLYNS